MTPPKTMTRLPRLKARLGGCSDSTIYRWIAQGIWPAPVRIADRAVAWPDSEIDAVIAARIAGATDNEIRALVARLQAERVA